MKPPIPYFGSKGTIADRIVSLLPSHAHYVEPFAGSLSVLLAKPLSRQETVNDLDGELITFWRVLRDRGEELARVCFLTPHSRAEQSLAYERSDDLDELELARRVFVQLTQGRNGIRRSTGWKYNVTASLGKSMPEYLAAYVERIIPAIIRLQNVTLECRPALDVIERYGRDGDVLLYCDPPYVAATRTWGNNYMVEMRDDGEHIRLAEALSNCRAAVLLSGYHSPLYDELFTDWHQVEISAATQQSDSPERTEVLWSNRPFAEHLFSEAVS